MLSASSISDIKTDTPKDTNQRVSKMMDEFKTQYKGDPFLLLATIPATEAWRFLIDGQDQKENPYFQSLSQYEQTESGYLLTTIKAFVFMLETAKTNPKHEKLIDFSKTLHKKALEGLLNGTNYHNNCEKPDHADCKVQMEKEICEFRNDNKTSVNLGKPTLDGLMQILENIFNDKTPWLQLFLHEDEFRLLKPIIYNSITLKNTHKISDIKQIPKLAMEILAKTTNVKDKNKKYLSIRSINDSKSKDEIVKKRNEQAEKLTINFLQQLSLVVSDFEKISCIVEFIKDLEQLHPFADGNGRTFVTLLQNYLLIINKLPPTILYQPNNYEGHSTQDLVNQMLEGMENVLTLAKTKLLYDEIPCSLATINNGLHVTIRYSFYQALAPLNPFFLPAAEKEYQLGFANAKQDLESYEKFYAEKKALAQKENEHYKKIVFNIENYLLTKRPWKLGLFGGKKIIIDEKLTLVTPKKIHFILNFILSEKLQEKTKEVNWKDALDFILYFGNLHYKKSKSKDTLRQSYYSLFTETKKPDFCQAFGMALDDPYWKKHVYHH